MTRPTTALLALLDLLDGRLSAVESERLRREIQRDPLLSQRWDELQALAAVPEFQQWLAPSHHPDEETLAAFVDERLEASEQGRIEQACWSNRSLLSEVRALRRAAKETNGVSVLPEATQTRLESLWESEDSIHPEGANGGSRRPSSRSRRAGARRRRRASYWNIGLSLAVAASVLALIAYWAWQRPTRQKSSPSGFQDVVTRPRAPDSPSPLPPPPAPRQRALPSARGDGTDSLEPQPSEANTELAGEPRKRDSGEVPSSVGTEPGPFSWLDETPSPSNVTDGEGTMVVLHWRKVRGVLAVLDRRLDKWFGPSASVDHEWDAYRSLPSSWAEAEPESWGRLVLAGDTHLSVVSLVKSDSASATPVVRLIAHYGGFGIRQLSPAQPIEIECGGRRWRLEAAVDASEVVFWWQHGRGRVVVLRGNVRWNGMRLKAGEQSVFSEERWLAGTSAAEANERSDRLAAPEQAVRLSSSLQRKLLASTDLLGDLRQLAASGSRRIKQIAWHWTLALAPEDSLIAALESRDPLVRQGAARWLVSQGIHYLPARQALRRLADETGEPRVVRELAQSIDFLHRHPDVVLPQVVAERFVRLLRANIPLIRSLSHALLSAALGDRVPYDPFGTPRERTRSIRAWGQVLRRMYGGSHNSGAKRPRR